MHTHHDNRTLLAELKALRAAVADPRTTAPNLLLRLGETSEKIEGSGYQVHPKPLWFSGAFVGVATQANAEEKPTDVDVTLRPDMTLRLTELDAIFGKHTAGRPNSVFSFRVSLPRLRTERPSHCFRLFTA